MPAFEANTHCIQLVHHLFCKSHGGPSLERSGSEGLNIDSWMELTVVGGHGVVLSAQPVQSDKKLYFVNLGAYADGQFTELHANALLVASSEREAKSRAKSELLLGRTAVHADDLFDVDDCLEISSVDGYHIVLEPTSDADTLIPNNGYHIIPKATIAKYIQQRQ